MIEFATSLLTASESMDPLAGQSLFITSPVRVCLCDGSFLLRQGKYLSAQEVSWSLDSLLFPGYNLRLS